MWQAVTSAAPAGTDAVHCGSLQLATSVYNRVCVCFRSGPNRGHYITIVKSHGFWLLFDDDIVEVGHSHSQSMPVCSMFLDSLVHLLLFVFSILLLLCRKSTPTPSRSSMGLPQTSPRTLSRDTSSSTSPGSDWSWVTDSEED